MMQTRRISILGIPFDDLDLDQAAGLVLHAIHSGIGISVMTPNPEIVQMARRDAELAAVIRDADLVVPDSVGIVAASRLMGCALRRRVPGIELVESVLERGRAAGLRVYLLGAAEGVADVAAERLRARYPGVVIAGTHHGYFSSEDEERIAADIISCRAQLVLVGLGCPKQEKWIARWKERLQGVSLITVGGSLDVFSGRTRRAPAIFRRLGLEWLYRLLSQPSRWRRQLELPRFFMAVLKERMKR